MNDQVSRCECPATSYRSDAYMEAKEATVEAVVRRLAEVIAALREALPGPDADDGFCGTCQEWAGWTGHSESCLWVKHRALIEEDAVSTP